MQLQRAIGQQTAQSIVGATERCWETSPTPPPTPPPLLLLLLLLLLLVVVVVCGMMRLGSHTMVTSRDLAAPSSRVLQHRQHQHRLHHPRFHLGGLPGVLIHCHG
jgi:hypothetical protein